MDFGDRPHHRREGRWKCVGGKWGFCGRLETATWLIGEFIGFHNTVLFVRRGLERRAPHLWVLVRHTPRIQLFFRLFFRSAGIHVFTGENRGRAGKETTGSFGLLNQWRSLGESLISRRISKNLEESLIHGVFGREEVSPRAGTLSPAPISSGGTPQLPVSPEPHPALRAGRFGRRPPTACGIAWSWVPVPPNPRLSRPKTMFPVAREGRLSGGHPPQSAFLIRWGSIRWLPVWEMTA